MGLTRQEQETVIRWDEDAKAVSIWSASPVTWRKLARLGIKPHRETQAQGRPTGKAYTLPFSAFRWGLKRRGLVGGALGNLTQRAPRETQGPATKDGASGGGADAKAPPQERAS